MFLEDGVYLTRPKFGSLNHKGRIVSVMNNVVFIGEHRFTVADFFKVNVLMK